MGSAPNSTQAKASCRHAGRQTGVLYAKEKLVGTDLGQKVIYFVKATCDCHCSYRQSGITLLWQTQLPGNCVRFFLVKRNFTFALSYEKHLFLIIVSSFKEFQSSLH